MPYPISIKKETIINLDSSTKYEDIFNGLTEDLIKSGSEVEIKENKLKISRCSEFSSRSSFGDFNRGQIDLDKSDNKVKITFKIYLVEHLVTFLGLLAIGTNIFFQSGPDSLMLKIGILLLIVNFVFCYLMPLMSLDSFVKNITNKTLKKHG